MKDFHQAHDYEDHAIECIPISDTIYSGALTADTAQDITVPAGATVALFASTGSFWLKNGATAAVPTTFGAQDEELNPVMRKVVAGDTISVISSSNIHLSVAFYKAK